VNFNQGSLLYELQKESYFSHFCEINADFSKEDFKQWFLKGSFLRTVVYYKQDFFRQNFLPPVQELESLPSKILTIFTVNIFWWVTRPPVPRF
jgi:hypothetical protein